MNNTLDHHQTLVTAGFHNPPRINLCISFLSQTFIWKRCEFPGTVITLFHFISKLLRINIQLVMSTGFGHGSVLENGTSFRQLRDGVIDFVGFDYYFNVLRDKYGIRSHVLDEHGTYMYTKAHYPAEQFNLPRLLGPVVFPIMCAVMLTVFLLESFHLHRLRRIRSKFSRCMNSWTTVSSLAVAGIVLNLYVSILSVKSIQQDQTGLDIKDIHHFRQLIEKGDVRLILTQNTSGIARQVISDLVKGLPMLKAQRIKSQLKHTKGDGSSEMIELMLKYSNSIAIGSRFSIQNTKAWLRNCDRIVGRKTDFLFGVQKIGFYFSRKHFKRIERFANLINKNMYAIRSMNERIMRRYMTWKQSNLKCADDWKPPPRFTISLGTILNTSFVISLYGLAAAATILLIELVWYTGKHMHSTEDGV